jgi:hypothetical protein
VHVDRQQVGAAGQRIHGHLVAGVREARAEDRADVPARVSDGVVAPTKIGGRSPPRSRSAMPRRESRRRRTCSGCRDRSPSRRRRTAARRCRCPARSRPSAGSAAAPAGRRRCPPASARPCTGSCAR